jgi:hypothetical protein
MANLLTTTIGGGSSLLVAQNRNAVSAAAGVQPEITDIDFVGTKPLTVLLIDFVADATAEVGANETIQAVFEIIQKYATIAIRGDLFDTGSQMAVFIETPNETADWNSDLSATTLATNIQNEVQALGGGTYGNNNFNTGAITVTVKTSINIS